MSIKQACLPGVPIGLPLAVPRSLRDRKVHGSNRGVFERTAGGVSLSSKGDRAGDLTCCFQALRDWKEQEVVFEGFEEMDEGLDSEGNTLSTREAMWETYTGDEKSREEWYTKGVNYWSAVEASVDGVLGGYGSISGRDIMESNKFLTDCLKTLKPDSHESSMVALDCGAGVGRVTKNLLMHHFNEIECYELPDPNCTFFEMSEMRKKVDLVEPVQQLIEVAQGDLHLDFDSLGIRMRKVHFFNCPLQEYVPPAERYDVIWIQWCIGHLTDVDVIEFFNRAKLGLKPGGFIVLKENIAKSGFVLDKEDFSVTRSDLYFRDLFQQGGLHVYQHRKQSGFPRDLFEVQMYCLTTELKKFKTKIRKGKKGNKPGIIK